MQYEGRKVIKSISMPDWFEGELLRVVNILAKDFKVSYRITTMKNNGFEEFTNKMFRSLDKKEINPRHLLAFRKCITHMQDYLWDRFRFVNADEINNHSFLKADYNGGVIHLVEGRSKTENSFSINKVADIIDQIANKTGSKELKEIAELARQGKAEIKVHEVSINKKPLPPLPSLPPLPVVDNSKIILKDMRVNIEGEEEFTKELEKLFNSNQDKGKLNKPKK